MRDKKKKNEIDEEIKPLVDAMNSNGWIETVSSCQGHYRHKIFDKAYVQFYCKINKIKTLCKILNMIEGKIKRKITGRKIDVVLDISLAFDEGVLFCQAEAPKGYLSLYMSFDDVFKKNYYKKILLDVATKCFAKK